MSIYIYMHMHMHMDVYMYLYMYMHLLKLCMYWNVYIYMCTIRSRHEWFMFKFNQGFASLTICVCANSIGLYVGNNCTFYPM